MANYTPGGRWKVITDLKNFPTHEEGGVDLLIGKNGVFVKNGQPESGPGDPPAERELRIKKYGYPEGSKPPTAAVQTNQPARRNRQPTTIQVVEKPKPVPEGPVSEATPLPQTLPQQPAGAPQPIDFFALPDGVPVFGPGKSMIGVLTEDGVFHGDYGNKANRAGNNEVDSDLLRDTEKLNRYLKSKGVNTVSHAVIRAAYGLVIPAKETAANGKVIPKEEGLGDPPVKPIYVTDPKDPRLKAYQDSLKLHNIGVEALKPLFANKFNLDENEWNDFSDKITNLEGGKLPVGEKTGNSYPITDKSKYVDKSSINPNIKPTKIIQLSRRIEDRPTFGDKYGSAFNSGDDFWYGPSYKAPVQPVVLVRPGDARAGKPPTATVQTNQPARRNRQQTKITVVEKPKPVPEGPVSEETPLPQTLPQQPAGAPQPIDFFALPDGVPVFGPGKSMIGVLTEDGVFHGDYGNKANRARNNEVDSDLLRDTEKLNRYLKSKGVNTVSHAVIRAAYGLVIPAKETAQHGVVLPNKDPEKPYGGWLPDVTVTSLGPVGKLRQDYSNIVPRDAFITEQQQKWQRKFEAQPKAEDGMVIAGDDKKPKPGAAPPTLPTKAIMAQLAKMQAAEAAMEPAPEWADPSKPLARNVASSTAVQKNLPLGAELPAEAEPDQTLIPINDQRHMDMASNTPVLDTARLHSNAPAWLLKDIITAAKRAKVDPYTALAIGLQETGFKEEMSDNPLRILWTAQNNNLDDAVNGAMDLLKDKMIYAKKHGKKTEAEILQAWNGYGKVGKHTEGEQSKMYGIDVTHQPIDMNTNPVYGKRILDLRENVIKKNPELVKLINSVTVPPEQTAIKTY